MSTREARRASSPRASTTSRASIAALVTDLGDRMADTVVLTMSEFGRAVTENGNRGTDHGHGNAMMVIGGGVRGGRVYGTWPGLARNTRYEGRDLAVTTDFRDVFGEIVVRHLGVADPEPIFPGYQSGVELPRAVCVDFNAESAEARRTMSLGAATSSSVGSAILVRPLR